MSDERRRAVMAEVRAGVIVLGAALMAIGCGMVYRPAGVIVAGALLAAVGLRGVR